MEINGKPGGNGAPGKTQFILSAVDETFTGDHRILKVFVATAGIAIGSIECELFGPFDLAEILTNVALQVRARQSNIVVPR